jgi:crotonobetainyl-CoA:carnitine CoA-transferase CaiB-like acyl-CoA transferase
MFKNFCNIIKAKNLVKNQKFNTNLLRNKNLNKLRIEIESKLKKKKSKYWVKIFKENKIPHSTINNVEDVIKNQQIRKRKMILDYNFDSVEGLKISGNPLKFSFLDINKNSRKSPNLDENRMEILKKINKV